MRSPLIVLVLALSLSAACSSTAMFQGSGYRVYTFEHDHANVHLVERAGVLLLIDSGYADNAEALDKDIRKSGFDPATIRAIVLTHGHADHAGGARYFQRRYHTKVIAGAGDRAMLASGHNEPLCPTGLLARLRRSRDQRASFEPTLADEQVSAPESLRALTGWDGEVIPLPGHTRGTLIAVIDSLVFAGDLFRGSVLGTSARVHLYQCDTRENQRDVARLLRTLAPRGQRFFVGHYGPVARDDVAAHFEVQRVE